MAAPTCDSDCSASQQRLERIATRFARKRDSLNRPAAKAAAGMLKKYD
jgi:hypothetical protein